MARIPEATIERVKTEVALAEVVAASGVALARRGKDLFGRCPFHEDAEASLSVSPGKGLWRCFGCGKGGTVIDWRMAISGESFRAAVESLAQAHLGGDPPAPGASVGGAEPAPLAAPAPLSEAQLALWLEASDEELRLRVAAHYHERLGLDPRAGEYLEKRGLADPGLLAHFRVGFADRTLGLLLPDKPSKAGETIRGRLQQLGILRESGHEHLNGSIVAPIVDLEGRVVQMYGRKVTPNLRPGTAKHLYLPGSLDVVYHPEALVGAEEVILCEAILDAWAFWSAGFRNVTTSFGANNFPPSLLAALQRHGTKRVLLAYDADEQGDTAAHALAERLSAAGIGVYRVRFPRGFDANEYAQKVQPAGKALDLVLRQAAWMGNGSPSAVRVPLAFERAAAETRPATKGEAATDPESLALVASATSPASIEAPSAAALSLAAVSSSAAAPAPAASLLPAAPSAEPACELRTQEVIVTLGDRRYRVRGLERNLSYDVLKVNLLAARGDAFHVDTFDLYAARARASFVQQAALELGSDPKVIQRDVGQVLAKLEELQDVAIRQALEPETATVSMSAEARAAAEAHLLDPRLIAKTLEDLTRIGIVGEETNKLVVYLATLSRKLAEPLAVVVQSSSAAGKSALLSGVLALVPEEDQVAYSAMTGQSLFYMGEKNLAHKVLAIAEEEGAHRAAYALKLLQSEGKLSIASTGKDPETGKLVTHEYQVEGPAAILTTTTAIDVDEEFLNRAIVLTVDESREQTEAIHRMQRRRRTLEGLAAQEERQALLALHRNVQQLLESLHVVNPFADRLSYPSTATRTRRDHTKYLALIDSIALLHQKQRPVETLVRNGREVRYVEATLEDITLANRLAHEVLGRSLEELPPQTARLLELLHTWVCGECQRRAIERTELRFTRREVRAAVGWGDTQLKMHLHRLEELEYLLVHAGRRGQTILYELAYGGEARERERFLVGLLDVEALPAVAYDGEKAGSRANLSGLAAEESGPSRPQVGAKSGGGRSRPEPDGAGLSVSIRPIAPLPRISERRDGTRVVAAHAS